MNRSSLTCETALDWIDDSVHGRLSTERSARLDAHLATCDACREAHADALAVRRALRAVPAVHCPDHVVARILAATEPEHSPAGGGLLDRIAGWLAGAMWRPIVVTAAAVIAIIAVTGRAPEPVRTAPPSPATARHTPLPSGGAVFCEDDIDELLATIDLRGIDEKEARQAAEEACLAFEILARAMNRAAGAAESGLMQSLEAPLKKGVESGIERLPAPLQRPGRETLERRG